MAKFNDSEFECKVDLKCIVNHFKGLKKINKTLFDIVLRILEVEMEI